MVSDQLVVRHKRQHRSYEDATEKRSIMHADRQILNDNQDLIAKHNSQHVFKVELSPDSYYNMDMLKKQYAKVHIDIDALFAEQEKIDNLLLSSDDDSLKTQSARLAYKIRDLQSYSRVAREIIWQYKYKRSLNAWISRSLDSYMRVSKI
ncbi:hypothetical protein BASA82_001013 [Batrachochytrium salamandrivorans]|nr:hypothetical protein BASA82_001013 [Batrachochytrium salamandrivorans]KAH9273716.1 hypothetical protein BASA83_004050 [Batrachochytrium salamandrivorans]